MTSREQNRSFREALPEPTVVDMGPQHPVANHVVPIDPTPWNPDLRVATARRVGFDLPVVDTWTPTAKTPEAESSC